MKARRAVKKLQHTRSQLQRLSSSESGMAFAESFSSFLSSVCSILGALANDLKGAKNHRPWLEAKKKELRDDPLIAFLSSVRNEDIHEGEHRLLFSTNVAKVAVPKSPPGAAFVMEAEGCYWVYDIGKPTERREPFKEGIYSTYVRIQNPPTSHGGKPIQDRSPVHLCQMALEYFEALVGEAEERFG